MWVKCSILYKNTKRQEKCGARQALLITLTNLQARKKWPEANVISVAVAYLLPS